MVQMPVLTPETFGDLHLISILIEGEIGSVIIVERRIGYKDVSFVRGGGAIPMTEQSTFLADYEAGQNVPVEYRATAGMDGETVTSDWVLADNLDSGDDFFFTLENPFLGMKLHVISLDSVKSTAPQTVVSVWGRVDPVVVSGVRHFPTGQMTVWTETIQQQSQLMQNLESGQVCAFSPWKPEIGMPQLTYVSVGNVEARRVSPLSTQEDRYTKMAFTEVKAPPAYWRYPLAESSTWGEVLAETESWSSILTDTWREVVGI